MKFKSVVIPLFIAIVITLLLQRTVYREIHIIFIKDFINGFTFVGIYLLVNIQFLKKKRSS
jgi:hypothetical protein